MWLMVVIAVLTLTLKNPSNEKNVLKYIGKEPHGNISYNITS